MRSLCLCLLLPLFAHAEERVALVVSGGISLGSYQGGVLFARLKTLKNQPDRRLETITGASAGAINAWLSVVAACDARADRLALFANPFFDIWTNVGLDVLLPTDPDPAAYGRLLADAVGSARIVRLGHEAAQAPAAPFVGPGHGLLTRNAFGVVGRYLVERLADDGYRDGCALATAVTLTGTEPATARLGAGSAEVAGVRAVVPLRVRVQGGRIEIRNDDGVLASGQAECLREGTHPWEACHPSAGRVLGLPQGPAGVAGPAVVRLVQGASAFPVAFSPVPMEVCATRAAGEGADPACAGLARRTQRFIDGGFFDNVPLGPAVELAHDDDLARAPQGAPLTFLYIDPDLRRGAPRLPEDRRRPDGLGGFTRLVNNAWREARAMELQGLERHCRHDLNHNEINNEINGLAEENSLRRRVCGPSPPGQRRFVPASRFHGITGRLAGSFGAFLHQGFRVHDYLVGVYDGVHATTEVTCAGQAAPCRAAAFRAAVEVVLADFDAPLPEAGHAPRRPHLEGHPATADDVRRFLYRLFADEHRALDPATATAFCAGLDARFAEAACGDGRRVLAHRSLVWAVQQVYAELDAALRASVLTADLQHRLQRAALETDLRVLLALEPFLATAPGRPGEVGADGNAWRARVVDQLLWRALAVERGDSKALSELGPGVVALYERLLGLEVTDGLQLARTAVAAGIERDDRVLDLDAGTTERLVGDHPLVPLLHLLPHHVVGDPLYGGILVGSTFHLRLRGLREPGCNPSFLQKFSLAVDGGLSLQDHHPTFTTDLSARLGGGLGYDPAGRLIDDLDLLYVYSRPLPRWDATAHGLELSVRLATKVRLAVGTYDLADPGLYFSVGLADWLALLVGLWSG